MEQSHRGAPGVVHVCAGDGNGKFRDLLFCATRNGSSTCCLFPATAAARGWTFRGNGLFNCKSAVPHWHDSCCGSCNSSPRQSSGSVGNLDCEQVSAESRLCMSQWSSLHHSSLSAAWILIFLHIYTEGRAGLKKSGNTREKGLGIWEGSSPCLLSPSLLSVPESQSQSKAGLHGFNCLLSWFYLFLIPRGPSRCVCTIPVSSCKRLMDSFVTSLLHRR